jgi:hypothetical protein
VLAAECDLDSVGIELVVRLADEINRRTGTSVKLSG